MSTKKRRRGRGGPGRLAAIAAAVLLAVLSAAISGFSCASGGGKPPPDLTVPRDLAGAPTMRVCLAKGAEKVTVEVRGPYEVFASDAKDAKAQFAGAALPPTAALPVPDKSGLSFGSYLFRPALVRLVAKSPGSLLVDGTAYRGDLLLQVPEGAKGILAVNRVNLEEYVAGVVGCEMPLLYPDAALRAQCIAARTYALYMARARAAERYDVMDDQSSQVYKGLTNETDKARQVTLETFGVVCTWRGKLFCTYFHSTCGGETIPASWTFGDAEIAPLMGGPCGFCQDSKYYRWRAEVPRAELAAKLAKEGFALQSVSRVEVAEAGPFGHVAKVRVTHPGGELLVKGSKFRFLVGASVVRQTSFEVKDAGGERILIEGKGFGHGVGMCQVGARGMARAGHDAAAILARYYPGADLVKLYPGGASVGGASGAVPAALPGAPR